MAGRIFVQSLGLLLYVAQCLSTILGSRAFVPEYRIHNIPQLCVSPAYFQEPQSLLAYPVHAAEAGNDPSNYCEKEDDEDNGDDDGGGEEEIDTDGEDGIDGHEEDDPYLGSYARNAEWLEQATKTVLDPEKLPLGSMTPDDVSSISGLMSAWVKRCSVEACLTVEQLLKRIVDDMRANNPDAYVTARMYTTVSTSYHCDP